MSIKLYVGRMGSGKTYEVVTVVVLNALARGRRVVSNVAGLNFEAMRAVLLERGTAETDIGELVSVDHAAVLEPAFWRTDRPDEDAFVQPGDLLALDEIWRFWNGFSTKDDEGRKRPDRVMNFFRMHRHFIHPDTGVCCDVALITQDVMDASRQVRAVVEETYSMVKMTAVGSSTRYRVDIFQGWNVKREPLRQLHRAYDPALFGLYESHSQKKEGGADAKEENIDSRGNIFGSPLFRVILPVGVVVLAFAVWMVWGFFHSNSAKPETATAKSAASGSARSHAMPDQSEEWRVVGYYDQGGGASFLLSNGDGVRVLQSPPAFKISALTYETFLPSGEAVVSWTGGRRTRGIVEAAAGDK